MGIASAMGMSPIAAFVDTYPQFYRWFIHNGFEQQIINERTDLHDRACIDYLKVGLKHMLRNNVFGYDIVAFLKVLTEGFFRNAHFELERREALSRITSPGIIHEVIAALELLEPNFQVEFCEVLIQLGEQFTCFLQPAFIRVLSIEAKDVLIAKALRFSDLRHLVTVPFLAALG